MRRREEGFALVSVLWIVALLGLAALAAAGQARRGMDEARLIASLAQARAAADAGAARAAFALLLADAGHAEPPATDGSPTVIEDVEIAVTDQGGLVDLNAAEPETLAAMLESLGVAAARAAALADAVADWRDEDDLARLNGAEATAYRRAGLAWRPRDGLFQTVDELRLVLGMDEGLFAVVAPLVTVHGDRPLVDIAVAPEPVLLATQGGGPDRVGTILALRAKRPQFAEPRTYGIRSVGHAPDGTVFVREQVVRITRDPARPLRTFLWRQGRG